MEEIYDDILVLSVGIWSGFMHYFTIPSLDSSSFPQA